LNSDTLSTIPLSNAFFRMKKENLLRDVGMKGKHLRVGVDRADYTIRPDQQAFLEG